MASVEGTFSGVEPVFVICCRGTHDHVSLLQ